MAKDDISATQGKKRLTFSHSSDKVSRYFDRVDRPVCGSLCLMLFSVLLLAAIHRYQNQMWRRCEVSVGQGSGQREIVKTTFPCPLNKCNISVTLPVSLQRKNISGRGDAEI